MIARGAAALLIFLSWLPYQGESVRCYECRSDETPSCGDKIFTGIDVKSVECNNLYTQSTFMCYTAVHYTYGTYTTVRGCAPFTSDNFNPQLQRGMAGTYWKNGNSLRLCDYDNCNFASIQQVSMAVLAFGLILTFIS
eukprot:TRINITY_DN33268_c0_g1_i1.p1 TRINITY_DN33268_c0_g1~~TRINITY_DN33268_c0_g1_i1.p1  ORF type:complete len:148 (+),score=9.71 TRINITY_DN33268_c0_g1_i1:33-446(+)